MKKLILLLLVASVTQAQVSKVLKDMRKIQVDTLQASVLLVPGYPGYLYGLPIDTTGMAAMTNPVLVLEDHTTWVVKEGTIDSSTTAHLVYKKSTTVLDNLDSLAAVGWATDSIMYFPICTIKILGPTTVDSSLTVTDSLLVSGHSLFTGNATISGNLSVTKKITTDSSIAVTDSLVVAGHSNFTGNATFSGNVIVTKKISTDSSVAVTDSLVVSGNTKLTGTLNVTGVATLDSGYVRTVKASGAVIGAKFTSISSSSLTIDSIKTVGSDTLAFWVGAVRFIAIKNP
jgi:hypothetical protein